jgi:hypothetical protein
MILLDGGGQNIEIIDQEPGRDPGRILRLDKGRLKQPEKDEE